MSSAIVLKLQITSDTESDVDMVEEYGDDVVCNDELLEDIDTSNGVVASLRKTIQEYEEKMDKLRDKLDEYENVDKKYAFKTMPIHMDLVSSVNNKKIELNKTSLSCWWCTECFDEYPSFIPKHIVDDTYYVFGCFCSFNCAVAYNIDMNDYKVWERLSLIHKMYNDMYNDVETTISSAPARATLKKFGGPLSIKEFRKMGTSKIMTCRYIEPPMAPISFMEPIVENGIKRCSDAETCINNGKLVLSRAKSKALRNESFTATSSISRSEY